MDVAPAVPKCTPAEIWKRAAAKDAPVDALAYLIYRAGSRPRWKFTITDKPRNVNIRHDFDDDCEVAVENP